MVYCQAYRCSNRPDKDKDRKRHYFRFPNPSKIVFNTNKTKMYFRRLNC